MQQTCSTPRAPIGCRAPASEDPSFPVDFHDRYALTAHRNGAGCCARGKSRARACGLAYRAAGGSASLKAALPAWGATAARLLGKRFAFSDRTAPHRTADRYQGGGTINCNSAPDGAQPELWLGQAIAACHVVDAVAVRSHSSSITWRLVRILPEYTYYE